MSDPFAPPGAECGPPPQWARPAPPPRRRRLAIVIALIATIGVVVAAFALLPVLAGEDDDEPVITPEIAEELDEIFGGPEPFTSADGQFSVVFPSIPTVTTGESPGPNGMTLPVTLVITELGDTASAVTWIDFDPDEIVFDLDQTVEEVATGVGGSVARSESVTWLDGDARDFTIDGAGEYILRGRTVVVGPRIYTLQGIATTETEAESILQGLIDSFVLNDEPVGDDAGAEAAQAVVGLGSR